MPLTYAQLTVLENFVHLGATLEDVRHSLADVFTFDFDQDVRTSVGHFRVPEPGVLVKLGDVQQAKQRQALGLITQADLMHWATMILHNEAFEIDAEDQDSIAEALNSLSFNDSI